MARFWPKGDSVILMEDLKIKGAPATLQRGPRIRGIHLAADAGEIECKVELAQS